MGAHVGSAILPIVQKSEYWTRARCGSSLLPSAPALSLLFFSKRRHRLLELARAIGTHVQTRLMPVANRGRLMPDVRLSDHSTFWDAGYDAVMVTDTSFLRNPHCHCMSEMIDTLDLPCLAAIIEGLDAHLSKL